MLLTIANSRSIQRIERFPANAANEFDVANSLSHDSRCTCRPFAVRRGESWDASGLRHRIAHPGITRLDAGCRKARLEGNQESWSTKMACACPCGKGAAEPHGAHRWTASHAFAEIGVLRLLLRGRDRRQDITSTRTISTWWRGPRRRVRMAWDVVGEKPDPPQAIRRYRLTVHRPDYTVPEWAADAIYYYIFPERFRNGDPANDPQARRRSLPRTADRAPRQLARTSPTGPAAATAPTRTTTTISSAATSRASSRNSTTSPSSAPIPCTSRPCSPPRATTSTTPPITAISIRISAATTTSSRLTRGGGASAASG